MLFAKLDYRFFHNFFFSHEPFVNHPVQRCLHQDFKCYLSQLSVELLENSSHGLDALGVLMEVSYAFKTIVDSPCSHDRQDKSKLITEVLLLSCNKDMENHKSLWSFPGVNGEQELILLRAGIFNTQHDVCAFTICPFHRSKLGIDGEKVTVHAKFLTRLLITVKGRLLKKTPNILFLSKIRTGTECLICCLS